MHGGRILDLGIIIRSPWTCQTASPHRQLQGRRTVDAHLHGNIANPGKMIAANSSSSYLILVTLAGFNDMIKMFWIVFDIVFAPSFYQSFWVVS